MSRKRILYRIIQSVLILFCIMTINFFLMRFMPGDPVEHILGEDTYFAMMRTNPETIEEIRSDYGLDRPLPVQYVAYLKKTICFDFGNSYRTKVPVLKTVMFRMKWTLLLAMPAIFLSAFLAGWAGLCAGYKQKGFANIFFSPVMLFFYTIPTNCMAILFLIVFSFKLGLFPISGITSGGLHGLKKTIDIFWHTVLPFSVLVILKMPSFFMLMKGNVQALREEEYVTSAASRGFSDGFILRRHLLKNALCPYITAVCMSLGNMFGGALMVETVFSWKGMGSLIYDSVQGKDYPVLQASFLIIGICVILFNLLADLINLVIDPRVRKGEKYA